jgi:hypothetical protein
MRLPRQALAITGTAAMLCCCGTAADAVAVTTNPGLCLTTTIPGVSGYMAADFASAPWTYPTGSGTAPAVQT